MYKTYQVLAKDTWDNIASKFHTSVDALQELNGMTMLIPGSIIVVPKVVESDYFTKYTIQKGDNLYEISKKFHTNVDVLLNANGLEKDDYLYPGQELLIPREGIAMYVTKEGETLVDVSKKLGTTQSSLIQDNEFIYLLPEQLILYKK